MKRKVLVIVFILILVIPSFYYLINFSAVNMGIAYLVGGEVKSDKSDLGEFGMINDLVKLNDSERSEYIKKYLKDKSIKFSEMPVTYAGGNIYINYPKSLETKNVLFVAHYDTYLDRAGALDNTGSVAVLLASLEDMRTEIESGKVSVLFTAAEEGGLIGSKKFVDGYMKTSNVSFDLVVNLDCVGSGNPVVVSSSNEAGLVINFFPFGKYLFNGESFSKPDTIWSLDNKKFDSKKFGLRSVPSIVGFSDTYSFLKNRMNAIHISTDNMKSIIKYSHKLTDMPTLLRKEYLDKTKMVILLIGKEY